MVSKERGIKPWLLNKNFLFTLIVLAMACFAWYEWRQSEVEKQKDKKQAHVFPDGNIQAVREIHIQGSEKTPKIHLIKAKDTLWYLKSPLQDMADAEAVTEWLQNVFAEKATPLKPTASPQSSQPINWSEYGLSDAPRSIHLQSETATKKLFISQYSAYDGSFFLKKNKKLLLGSTAWAGITEHPADLLRSYKLLNIPARPLSIKYNSKTFQVQLNWEQNTWKRVQTSALKKPFPISQPELESYWQGFSKIEFQKENIYNKTSKNIKKYRLHKPFLQIQLSFKKPYKEWMVGFSKKNKSIYVSLSNRDYIFTLKQSDMEKVFLTEKKIRDHHQPFHFNPNQVGWIELKSINFHLQFKRDNTRWVLVTRPEENNKKSSKNINEKTLLQALSKERASITLNRILDLSAEEYIYPVKNFKPESILILSNKEKNPLLTLQFSKIFKKDGAEVLYAQSNKEESTMLLSAKDFKEIFFPKPKDKKNKNP